MDTTNLVDVLAKLLEKDAVRTKIVDETREDLQRSEIEVKKYLLKAENLANENEIKDRKIASGLQREGKQLKRNDDLERKLKEKTETARKLTLTLKNTEAKFKIDKRKVEMELAKLKEKLYQINRGASRAKPQKLGGIINSKGKRDIDNSLLDGTRRTGSTEVAASNLEENNRHLIERNSQLKSALINSYSKIIETMKTFPNYQNATEQKIIDMADINPISLVSEIGSTCNQLEDLICELEEYQSKRMTELEADLAARQEKIMVTKVAEIETEVEELKKQKENVSDEVLFQKMNEFIDQNSFSSESTSDEYLKMDAIIAAEKGNRTPEAFKRAFGSNSSTPLHRSLLEQKAFASLASPSVKPTALFEKNSYENDSLND